MKKLFQTACTLGGYSQESVLSGFSESMIDLLSEPQSFNPCRIGRFDCLPIGRHGSIGFEGF